MASITKLIINLIIHHLVYLEKLKLTTKVKEIFGSGECSRSLGEVTISQLLTHSIILDLPAGWKQTRGIETVRTIMMSEVRHCFRYGNFCAVILGEIVKRIGGKDLPSAFRSLFRDRPIEAEGYWFHEICSDNVLRVAPTADSDHSTTAHDGLTNQIASGDPVTTCGVAGLFANATMISWIVRILLNGGIDPSTGRRLFGPDLPFLLSVNGVAGVPRGLAAGDTPGSLSKSEPRFSVGGSDMLTPFDYTRRYRGMVQGVSAYGGFTGCGYFADLHHDDLPDPSTSMGMVVLSNAILGKQKEPRIALVRRQIWIAMMNWYRANSD